MVLYGRTDVGMDKHELKGPFWLILEVLKVKKIRTKN